MALIPKYHVIAAVHDRSTDVIIQGMFVYQDATTGQVKRADETTLDVLGVAGDSKSLSPDSGMPGAYEGWQNRASDSFDETKASRKMTVYESGGEFATDQFEADVETADIGDPLYVSHAGKLMATPAAQIVARLTRAAGAYPSGVPGTDINGDMALRGAGPDTDNPNMYIEFRLTV